VSGDDVRQVTAARSVSNDDYSTGEQAPHGKPFLSIIEAVIQESNATVAERLMASAKANRP
jgi:hypothetical protein